ncbi:unnamed protein product [Camellia sinensis]
MSTRLDRTGCRRAVENNRWPKDDGCDFMMAAAIDGGDLVRVKIGCPWWWWWVVVVRRRLEASRWPSRLAIGFSRKKEKLFGVTGHLRCDAVNDL